ncbi:uncharacterized protein TRIADDRAFT_32645 [Trichoplax adhaerens]|uniref:Carboxypeptidase n=1 Tax=Trichoplax adhaerens TaxID=10228 RepID=B3SBA3_TRIAD|nr:hypothetical protein TRIADDRAFT_32645 [Trichoplax adhaerens]EDV19965.1 hypothetical protein TRIADDRAFT_32645 [Trichoplax adhaerens]|eukprot:XP_002117555.1 hypothetical protein TRIADDRAFT_32645 [Trichoplax adhaerens]
MILWTTTLHPGNAAPKEDWITSLPGLSHQSSFKQYSGYLDGGNGNRLHYWFVESKGKPLRDPLVLWLNGGPGCSSIIGLLLENGPFMPSYDGKHLTLRNTSWNDFANVIFLESPAGVGYSYNDKRNYTWDDDQVADSNYAALKSFFNKFPEYSRNEFYITGESYGGIYIPTLVLRTMNDSKINLKAFAVGNGLMDTRLNDNSMIYFAYYHGIFGQHLWSQLQKYCCSRGSCNFHNPSDIHCKKALAVAQQVMNDDLDNYNIYFDCFHCSSSMGSQAKVLLKRLHPELYPSRLDEPYMSNNQVTPDVIYMNRKDVRKALHIPDHLPAWNDCSNAVSANYTTTYNSSIKLIPKLLKKYRVLIYNGDVDMVCNFLGDQWAVHSLNLKVVKPRQPWFYNDSNGKQVGGYVIRANKLDFLTVRGSGHQVPTFRPQQAYQMIYNFIHNRPYSTKVVP